MTLFVHILTGVEPADGSEQGQVARLKLPEFPKNDEGLQPLPSTGTPKVPASLTGLEADPPSSSTSPFVLSEGLPPVPAKLVAKIQKGDYVDMAELLRDNMEWERRLSSSDSSGSKIGRASRREVPDLLSWITCFGIYASVVCDKSPEKAKQLLAYQTLIVREARRCGGKGWQSYDSMFRQQVANKPEADWSVLNSSLYTTSFLANQNGRGRTCKWCLETDHASTSCALAPPSNEKQQSRPNSYGRDRDLDSTPFSDRRSARWGRNEVRGACFAWNEGRCSLPYCRWRHVCCKCGSADHRESTCSSNRNPSVRTAEDRTGSHRESAPSASAPL